MFRNVNLLVGIWFWMGAMSLLQAGDCWHELPLQNPRDLAIGETIYLPRLQASSECPLAAPWILETQPEGSLSKVYADDNQEARLTPDVPGDYRLRAQGTERSFAVHAVDRKPQERYRNHYLTPLFGLARVDNELWVANGAAYSVSKLERGSDGSYHKAWEAPTGAWPAAVVGDTRLSFVLVAQRAADSIAFLERKSGRLLDAVWVGDEPTGLALSPDAHTLYISLPTEGQVVVLDVLSKKILGRIAVGFDPRAMVLSPDGSKLYVASYRSGNQSNGPGQTRPREEDQDIFVIDTQTRRWVRTLHGLSADIRALSLEADRQTLWLAAFDGKTAANQTDPKAEVFVNELVRVRLDADTTAPDAVQRWDLGRAPKSQGPFVHPSGLLLEGNRIWVAAEGSDQVLILDRSTGLEQKRIAVGRGPRQLVLLSDGVAVHCFRDFEVDVLSFEGTLKQRIKATEDPRSPREALGEQVFSRPGLGFGEHHACASCHIETQNDGMIWAFGPGVYHNVRPLQLGAATTPMGWGGYVSSAASFGYMGPYSIMNRPPTQEEALGLGDFLGSLLGAPRATQMTEKDGSYSPEGLRGKSLFEGKAQCARCHEPPLYTNRTLLAKGKSGIEADVPSLLGVYRHGIYLVKGQARKLEQALDIALDFVKVQLTAGERDDLLRFLRELTPKGAYPLGMWPDRDQTDLIPKEAQPWMSFSEDVDASRSERSAEEFLEDYAVFQEEDGADIPFQIEREGHRLRFVPQGPLTPGRRYRFGVRAGLPFRDGSVLDADRLGTFAVAASPAPELPARLRMKVLLGFDSNGANVPKQEKVLDFTYSGKAPEGQRLRLDLGDGRSQEVLLWQDGRSLHFRSFALPIPSAPGKEALADASEVRGAWVEGKQGRREARGTLTIGAPGLRFKAVPWTLEQPSP